MRCLLQICCPSSLLFSHRQWSKELRMATQTLGLGSSPRLQTGKSGLQACPLKHAARPASHVQQLLDLLATYLVRAALPEQDLDLGDVNEWDPLVQLGRGHMQLYSYGTAYLPDYMRVLRLLSTLLPALLMVPETCSLPSISLFLAALSACSGQATQSAINRSASLATGGQARLEQRLAIALAAAAPSAGTHTAAAAGAATTGTLTTTGDKLCCMEHCNLVE